jgi:hypothetical protein
VDVLCKDYENSYMDAQCQLQAVSSVAGRQHGIHSEVDALCNNYERIYRDARPGSKLFLLLLGDNMKMIQTW